ncbi:MAG: hypothetical protein ABR502_08565, partial [Chitinophagaceae bacterium]
LWRRSQLNNMKVQSILCEKLKNILRKLYHIEPAAADTNVIAEKTGLQKFPWRQFANWKYW